MQLTLFAAQEHPLLDELRQLDLDATAPLTALQHLAHWQETLRKEDGKSKP